MKVRLIAIAVMACCSLGALAAQDGTAGDEVQAVREANEGFYAALNTMFTGDVTLMQSVWSHREDVTYLGPDGSFIKGWEATLKDWEKQAAMKLEGNIEPAEIRITVGGDMAIVHNYEVGENIVDGTTTPVKIRATNVYRKENGAWKMIGHHTDLLPFLDK